MRGAKAIDGKRVRLLRDFTTNGGTKFSRGEVVKFRKQGVVRCGFRADDGRELSSTRLRREDFEVVESQPR